MTVQALSPYITQDHQALVKKREFDAKFHETVTKVCGLAALILIGVAIFPLSSLQAVTLSGFLSTSVALFALALFSGWHGARAKEAKSDANSYQKCADKFNTIKDWSSEQITAFLLDQGIKVEDYTDVEKGAMETRSPRAPLKALLPLMARYMVAREEGAKVIQAINLLNINLSEVGIGHELKKIHSEGVAQWAKKPHKTAEEKYTFLFLIIALKEMESAAYLQSLRHPLTRISDPAPRYFDSPKEGVTISAPSILALRERLRA